MPEINALVKELVSFHGYLKAHRNDIDALWTKTNSIFRPELGTIDSSGDNAGRYNAHVFDSMGAQSLATWSRGMVGNMAYPKPQWLQTALADRRLMEDDQVIDYMQEWSEQLFHAFNSTNFYSVLPEMALDAGTTVGYLMPTVDKEHDRLHFQHEHPGDVWYALDVNGEIDRVHREIKMTAKAAEKRFGIDNLSSTAKGYLKSNPFTEIMFVHCVFPNPDFEPSRQEPFAAEFLPWASVYYERSDQTLTEKSGLPWMIMAWRVHRRPRLWYPYTPAQCALTDALVSNSMSESLVHLTQLLSDPPLVARQGRNIVQTPGGITRYKDPNETVKQLYDRLDWGIPDAERDRVHNSIERWLGVPFFTLLSRQAERAQPPTAYQISQEMAEKATLLGPQVSSMSRDILDPAIDVMWQWETETSTVPEMPQILLDILMEQKERTGIAEIPTINEYTGILSQIQSQAIKTRTMTESLEMASVMIELFPQSKFVLKEYNLMKDILQNGNMDQDNIRPEEEYIEHVQALMEDQALQDQAERQSNVASAYQKVAQGNKANAEAA